RHEVEAEPGAAHLLVDLIRGVKALVEVADQHAALEAAEAIAHRHREALAVAAVLDDGAVIPFEGSPLLAGLGDERLAAGVDRRVVERVHQHLVAALLDRLAVLAADPDGGGELRYLRDGGRFLLVVA